MIIVEIGNKSFILDTFEDAGKILHVLGSATPVDWTFDDENRKRYFETCEDVHLEISCSQQTKPLNYSDGKALEREGVEARRARLQAMEASG